MSRIAAIVALGWLTTACASGSVDQTSLAYTCGDIVVRGTLTTLDSGPTESVEGDILGHGWFSAELYVRRSLVGSGGGSRLKVRYFSHAAIRAGREFVFVLMPGDDGGYAIRRFAATSTRLENECGLTKRLP